MNNTLEKLKNSGKIEDYKVIANVNRKKTGIPSHDDIYDEIYLYFGGSHTPLDETKNLKPQISSIEMNTPWIYVYYVPPKDIEDVDELQKLLFDELVEDVGKSLYDRFKELFE